MVQNELVQNTGQLVAVKPYRSRFLDWRLVWPGRAAIWRLCLFQVRWSRVRWDVRVEALSDRLNDWVLMKRQRLFLLDCPLSRLSRGRERERESTARSPGVVEKQTDQHNREEGNEKGKE